MAEFVDAALDSPQWGMVARVALAMVLGALVGFERELRSKPPGCVPTLCRAVWSRSTRSAPMPKAPRREP